MSSIHRRDLFRAAGTSAMAMSAVSYSSVQGANDRIQLGVIGCGGRGSYVMGLFQATNQVDVVALCDIYGAQIEKTREKASNAKGFSDHRELLEMNSLDAVLIATPDHWHAITAIDSLNAGKDVYVEKPLTRTIEEGPEIIKAARVNNRICQVGMQQRSGMQYWKAKQEYIDSGKIGKVNLVQTVWHSGVGSGGGRRDNQSTEKPSDLDWAHFLGPVKWRDWDYRQYRNWRGYLDFGGGKITDLFAHWGDAVHMVMGDDGPVSVVAAGGVFNNKDGRDAPDTIYLNYEYRGEYIVTFESAPVVHVPTYAIWFCGTQGRLMIDRNKYIFQPAEKGAPEERFDNPERIDKAHVENFVECCRTRERPNGDVYHGHRGAQAAHLGTMAYIQKRRIRFDPDKELVYPT